MFDSKADVLAHTIIVAQDREETEPCERGTVGCCVDHTLSLRYRGDHGDCDCW